jgi:hypothetical protein
MQSVFQKFGGIRPMAARLGVPSSTVKSWHTKQFIPEWRRPAVLDAAKRLGIGLLAEEVATVRPDEDPSQQAAA